jgi:tetratricopeptide (TPR) repeat protein
VGQDALLEGNYAAAIEAFNKSLKIAISSKWTPKTRSETFYLIGNTYLLLGKQQNESDYISRALNNYRNAVKIDPFNYDAWVRKSMIENKLNLSKDAKKSSLQAIKIMPNYGYAAWNLLKDYDSSGIAIDNSNISQKNTKMLFPHENVTNYSFKPCILPLDMELE